MSRPFLTARWRDLVLVNYPVPDALAASLVPPGCEVDRWQGNCYVSLVALWMDRVRVRGWVIPGLTTYPQVNLRVYVRHAGRPAVTFIGELVRNRLLAAAARRWYGEPFRAGYIRSQLAAEGSDTRVTYAFGRDRAGGQIEALVTGAATLPDGASFAHWLKERTRGCRTDRRGHLRTFDVAHPRWPVRDVRWAEVRVDFAALYGPDWSVLDGPPASVVYAVGSSVSVSAAT